MENTADFNHTLNGYRLSKTQYKVLRHIGFRQDGDSGCCWEQRQNIAKRLGLSRMTLHRAICALATFGMISVYDPAHGRTSEIVINPKEQWIDRRTYYQKARSIKKQNKYSLIKIYQDIKPKSDTSFQNDTNQDTSRLIENDNYSKISNNIQQLNPKSDTSFESDTSCDTSWLQENTNYSEIYDKIQGLNPKSDTSCETSANTSKTQKLPPKIPQSFPKDDTKNVTSCDTSFDTSPYLRKESKENKEVSKNTLLAFDQESKREDKQRPKLNSQSKDQSRLREMTENKTQKNDIDQYILNYALYQKIVKVDFEQNSYGYTNTRSTYGYAFPMSLDKKEETPPTPSLQGCVASLDAGDFAVLGVLGFSLETETMLGTRKEEIRTEKKKEAISAIKPAISDSDQDRTKQAVARQAIGQRLGQRTKHRAQRAQESVLQQVRSGMAMMRDGERKDSPKEYSALEVYGAYIEALQTHFGRAMHETPDSASLKSINEWLDGLRFDPLSYFEHIFKKWKHDDYWGNKHPVLSSVCSRRCVERYVSLLKGFNGGSKEPISKYAEMFNQFFKKS